LSGLASFGRGSTADAQERLNLLVCAEQNALFTPEGAMTKPLLLISELAASPGQHHSLRAASLTAQPAADRVFRVRVAGQRSSAPMMRSTG
jgi:hypothetical protein